MSIVSDLVASRRRRWGPMAGSLVAVPLFMASCQPACEPAPPAAPRVVEQRQIGTSVQGRPITAYRLGTAGGTVVLAIGSIHGDEQAGIEIIEHIRDAASIPAGFDVWVVPTINPDGNVANAEPNAAGIDLNRNFPPNWEPIDCPTNPTNCSGPEPLSEPESRAVAALITEIKPRMTVWYHAVGPVVDQATLNGVANPAVLTTYGAAAGYGVATVNCGPTGYCIGNATQFGNFTVAGSSAFVVELSTKALGGLTPAGVDAHANAFWAAAAVA